MSAITDTQALPAQETRSDSGQPTPGVAAAVRVELAKLSAQWPLRITLALCVIVPAGFAVVMRAASSRPADTLFGRWAGTSGFATSLTVLNWAVAYGAPLLAGLVAGDMFASEDRHGTWKTILTRSTTRARIFAGKAIAATLCVWVAFAVIGVVSLVASLAAIGSTPLVGLSGQLIGTGHAFALVVASWALMLLPTTMFVAFGLLLSIASRSGAIGVLGPLLVAIVLQLLEAIASGQIVRSILPSTPSDAWHALFTTPMHTAPIVQGIITSLGYTIVFAGAAWWLLRRRDFAAEDAVPAAHRRTAVRIAMAVAAVSVALVASSGVGPTALSARRLETSIAATFGHLAEVRYQWENGAKADTSIPWHAVCNRGGTPITTVTGTGSGKGAGDDWACTITDLRASDGAGATQLDVTLKPNGCYQVQSPPGAVGALYINDKHGKAFINPLYAFDGCVGTP